MATVTSAERQFLREAVDYLENPSYLMKLADAIGKPLHAIGMAVVPEKVATIGQKVLLQASNWAANSVWSPEGNELDFAQAQQLSGWDGFWHKVATGVAGAGSGAFGLAGLAVELPVTTGIMVRSIAAIAARFGEDTRDPAVRLECVSILGQGGGAGTDDALQSTYLTARVGMSALIRDAATVLAREGSLSVAEMVTRGTAPAMVALIGRIASQFNIRVSEKLAAQSVPVFSAVTGAAINVAFTDHFNRVATYHFGIRKLERQYGTEVVQAIYTEELRRVKE